MLQAAAASGQLSWSSHTDRQPSSNGRQLQNGTTGAALLDWGEDPFWQVRWPLQRWGSRMWSLQEAALHGLAMLRLESCWPGSGC